MWTRPRVSVHVLSALGQVSTLAVMDGHVPDQCAVRLCSCGFTCDYVTVNVNVVVCALMCLCALVQFCNCAHVCGCLRIFIGAACALMRPCACAHVTLLRVCAVAYVCSCGCVCSRDCVTACALMRLCVLLCCARLAVAAVCEPV